MKPQDKVLTVAQAKELRWFCKNVAGNRTEFYEAFEVMNKFKAKLDKLNGTCEMIDKYFAEHPELELPDAK